MIRQLCHLLLIATTGATSALVAPSPPGAHASQQSAAVAGPSRVDPVLKLADIELQIGQTAPVDNGAIDLTFTRIVEDSRCPMNALCYWQGRAVVELKVRHLDGSLTDELLTTLVMQGRQPPALGLATDGYLIHLMSLTPYPVAGNSVGPSDQGVLVVRVSRT